MQCHSLTLSCASSMARHLYPSLESIISAQISYTRTWQCKMQQQYVNTYDIHVISSFLWLAIRSDDSRHTIDNDCCGKLDVTSAVVEQSTHSQLLLYMYIPGVSCQTTVGRFLRIPIYESPFATISRLWSSAIGRCIHTRCGSANRAFESKLRFSADI